MAVSLAVSDNAARKITPAPDSVGSMTFDIRPTASPTSDKDRAAKLVDPGFGRVFTDHMAIVRYSTAKGWHDARVESRANFPLDPALAVLHYAQEIFEGLKAYKRDDGGVNLFRPDANARRFRNSADRMAMAQAARSRLHRGGRAARAHRPRLDPGRRGQSLSAALHDRERGVPRREAVVGIYLRGDRLAGRLLFQGRARAGLDLGVGELHPRRDRRHRRRQMRRQLRREPARAGRSHRARLRPGRVPRRGRAPLCRGTRRHEHLLRLRRRLAARRRRSAPSCPASPATPSSRCRRMPASACARSPIRSSSGARMPPAAS